LNAAFRLMLIVMAGYAAAVIAAPVLVLVLHTLSSVIKGTQPPTQWEQVLAYLMVGMTLTSTYAAAPFLGSIAVLRLLQRHDWITHVLAGALTARCAVFLASSDALQELDDILVPIIVGGAGAGFVYWLVRRHFGWVAA
jgi:hypothetical protein